MASKLVLVVVFVLDLIAFGLAVGAEQRRSTVSVDSDGRYNYCIYDTDIATGLGVSSLLCLFVSQVLIMVVSRCYCCGKPLSPGRSRAWAIFLFIACWVSFIIAEVCLLAGSARNAYHTKYRFQISDNPPSCQTLRKGVFGAGAAFVIVTGILTELYYVFYSKAKDFSKPPYGREAGIGMSTYN